MAEAQVIPTVPWRPRRTQRRRRGLFARRRIYTAIDLDGQTLRVVQTALRRGKPKVLRLAVATLPAADEAGPTDATTMGRRIAETLAKLGVKPGPVIMGIPRAAVVLRPMTLPLSHDVRELAAMVHFQIAKDLPFRPDEAVIDFKIQQEVLTRRVEPENDAPKAAVPEFERKLEVLVAAVKREVVDQYRTKAAAAGLNLIALGLRSYANVRCVDLCEVAPPHEGVVLVSLRPDEVMIDMLVDETLAFSRVAVVKGFAPRDAADPAANVAPEAPPPPPAGPPDLAEPPAELDSVDAVVIEVVRSLHSYEGMEQHSRVARVLVAGDTGQEDTMVEALSKRLSVPCSRLDPGPALGLTGAHQEQARGAIAALGLGLAIHDRDDLPFDFLSPKQPPAARNNQRLKLLGGLTLAVTLFVGFFGLRHHLIQERLKQRDTLSLELAEAQKKLPIFRRLRNQMKSVEGWLDEGQSWLDQYAYLSAILPPSTEVYVGSITTGPRGSIRLALQARSGEIIAQLDARLREAGYDVKPLAITPGSDKYGYPFKSTVELGVPKGMKVNLTDRRPPPRPADDASMEILGAKRGGAR